MSLVDSPWGIAALAVFVAGYVFVVLEERLRLRKSVPMLAAAALIWLCVALAYRGTSQAHLAAEAFRHVLLEYAELFLFLLSAMTFVNTLEERAVFHTLRDRLVRRGLHLRAIFWVTGAMAFAVSPIADNLTTALVMGAVVVAVGQSRPAFVTCGCVNVVVAANAGGAFSPFGDITTLMVWQKGHLAFGDFFALFLPSAANWIVPAVIMARSIPKERPAPAEGNLIAVKPGGVVVACLLLGTITFTVTIHQTLHLPPVFGMMAGLGTLKLYGYLLKRKLDRMPGPADSLREDAASGGINEAGDAAVSSVVDASRDAVDVFAQLERLEWDTLMFFYGVMLAIGGLGALGYLAAVASTAYGPGGAGATAANLVVGLASAIIDNIPIMYTVLSMSPDMSRGQWLLVTLTAGVGGSLLSIGSAAGVALMGQARGSYTFLSHLRWSWAIALGFAASVGTHFVVNGRHF